MQHRDRNHQVCLLNGKRAHSCAGHLLVYAWGTGLNYSYRHLANNNKMLLLNREGSRSPIISYRESVQFRRNQKRMIKQWQSVCRLKAV
jgi:hypothetical protein